MEIIIGFVSLRTQAKSSAVEKLVVDYVERSRRLASVDCVSFASEGALLQEVNRSTGRVAAQLTLFDSRGDDLTSEQFAAALGKLRDEGVQRLILAIGPADGWSKVAIARAGRVLALGRLTLPHEVARVVVAEQVYRALTILAGHPYHCGH